MKVLSRPGHGEATIQHLECVRLLFENIPKLTKMIDRMCRNNTYGVYVLCCRDVSTLTSCPQPVPGPLSSRNTNTHLVPRLTVWTASCTANLAD